VKSSMTLAGGANFFSHSQNLLEQKDPSSFGEGALTPVQTEVDGLVGSFVQQAADWRSLAAMTAGGMAYRLGRVGSMSVRMGAYCYTPLQIASVAIGLGAEVTAFEMTNRALMTVGANGRSPLHHNLWRWEGPGGIRRGLLSSLITFGTLKGAGRLVQGENVVVQHLLQDTGMVLGHQLSGVFGIAQRPTGTLVEQLLHAEAVNLQIGAGMALGHRFAPGIQGLERGLDLSLRPLPFVRQRTDQEGWNEVPALATEGARRLVGPTHESSQQELKGLTVLHISNNGDDGPPSSQPPFMEYIPPVIPRSRSTDGNQPAKRRLKMIGETGKKIGEELEEIESAILALYYRKVNPESPEESWNISSERHAEEMRKILADIIPEMKRQGAKTEEIIALVKVYAELQGIARTFDYLNRQTDFPLPATNSSPVEVFIKRFYCIPNRLLNYVQGTGDISGVLTIARASRAVLISPPFFPLRSVAAYYMDSKIVT
jgi:hypothetical protein